MKWEEPDIIELFSGSLLGAANCASGPEVNGDSPCTPGGSPDPNCSSGAGAAGTCGVGVTAGGSGTICGAGGSPSGG